MKRESAICGGGLVNCRGGEGGGFTIDIYTRDRINRLFTLRFNYCVSSSTSSSPLLVRIFPSTNLSVYLVIHLIICWIPFGGYYNNSCDINHEQVDRCLKRWNLVKRIHIQIRMLGKPLLAPRHDNLQIFQELFFQGIYHRSSFYASSKRFCKSLRYFFGS